MLRTKFNQAGETIIEVLLGLAILGIVLGVAYASASRSLRGSQDAQERTEASQIAQSLIEVITNYARHTNDPAIEAMIYPVADSRVCLKTDISSIEDPTDPDRIVLHPNAGICERGIYTTWVDIHPLPGIPQSYEYTAHVEWPNIVSGNISQSEIRYKWVRITP